MMHLKLLFVRTKTTTYGCKKTNRKKSENIPYRHLTYSMITGNTLKEISSINTSDDKTVNNVGQ